VNKQRVARELVRLAREIASAKKPKYTSKDIDAITKQLEEFVKRGGREYGDYQFNIKLYRVDIPDAVREEYGDNRINDVYMLEAGDQIERLVENVKRRFGWVRVAGSAGRSNGWFVVVDDDATMDSLEQAAGAAESRDELDKEDPYYEEDWNDLEEEVNGAVEEGKQKVRDLKEIEKMVKSGVADYVKDMESEDWWRDTLG